jgi:hypothetical protein
VSIDMIGNDSSETGSLEAYDAAGNQIDIYNSPTVGNGGIATMTVESLTTPIAYVIAGGTNGNTVDLDNLQFDGGGETSTFTDGAGNYGFTNLSPGDYDVAEVQQPSWVQTFPQSGGSHLLTIGPAQDAVDVDFGNQYVPPPPLLGDYNLNGVVEMADYSMWRNTLGQSGIPLYHGADGSGNGVIDRADYRVWKEHFGDTLPSGGGGAIAEDPAQEGAATYSTAIVVSSAPAESTSVASVQTGSPAAVVPFAISGQATQPLLRDGAVSRPIATAASADQRDDALLAWLSSYVNGADGGDSDWESDRIAEDAANDSPDSFTSAVDEAFEALLVDAA